MSYSVFCSSVIVHDDIISDYVIKYNALFAKLGGKTSGDKIKTGVKILSPDPQSLITQGLEQFYNFLHGDKGNERKPL